MSTGPQNSASGISLVALVTCLLAADASAAQGTAAICEGKRDLTVRVGDIVGRLDRNAPELMQRLAAERRVAQWRNR